MGKLRIYIYFRWAPQITLFFTHPVYINFRWEITEYILFKMGGLIINIFQVGSFRWEVKEYKYFRWEV